MLYKSSKSFIQFNISYVIYMLFVCNSYVICISIVCTRISLYVFRMSLVRTCMSFVCCVPVLSFACTRISFVYCSYTFMSYVCHAYLLECNGMSPVCTRMSFLCHSYVLVCNIEENLTIIILRLF